MSTRGNENENKLFCEGDSGRPSFGLGDQVWWQNMQGEVVEMHGVGNKENVMFEFKLKIDRGDGKITVSNFIRSSDLSKIPPRE